jgi:hypothetical protein
MGVSRSIYCRLQSLWIYHLEPLFYLWKFRRREINKTLEVTRQKGQSFFNVAWSWRIIFFAKRQF